MPSAISVPVVFPITFLLCSEVMTETEKRWVFYIYPL